MVPVTGLEPARTRHLILSQACLPVSPHRHIKQGTNSLDPEVGIEPTFSIYQIDDLTFCLFWKETLLYVPLLWCAK